MIEITYNKELMVKSHMQNLNINNVSVRNYFFNCLGIIKI